MIRAFLSVLLVLGLGGCTTLNHRDLRFVGSHQISTALYAKMSHHEPLTVDDIIELWEKGIPGPFIVHYLQPTYYVYKLSPDDVSRLRTAGVDDVVVRYLLATPGMYSPSHAPVWYEDNPTIYDTHPGLSRY